MAEPRKVFRIESTAAARLDAARAPGDAAPHAEIMQALNAMRALLAAGPQRGASAARSGATARLSSELNLIQSAIGGSDRESAEPGAGPAATSMTRIVHELNAVITGSEQATEKILNAAEEIDQVASNLSAALRGRFEQDFAEDIQDLVIKIFEACNFQDLIGQRVTKVMATLKVIEDHVVGMLNELNSPAGAAVRRDGMQELRGPRLESDSGHITQSEVDALFGRA